MGRYLLVTRSFSRGDNNEFVNNGKSHGLDSQSILNELLAYQTQTFVPTPSPTLFPTTVRYPNTTFVNLWRST